MRSIGRKGTATIELALVAPVIIATILSGSDVAMSALAKFKSVNATATGVDIAAQAANLQNADMADVFAGAMNAMAPFDTATLSLRITSVASNGLGGAFVHWSCGIGSLAPFTAKSNFKTLANGDDVSNALLLTSYVSGGFFYNGANTSFIQVESAYAYTAPAQFLMKGPQAMAANYINFPRQTAYVGFPWNGVTTNPPPAPNSTTKTASVALSNGANCNYAY